MYRRKPFKNYKYYLSLFFALTFFGAIYFIMVSVGGGKSCVGVLAESKEECLSTYLDPNLNSQLITDKNIAKIAHNNPQVLAVDNANDTNINIGYSSTVNNIFFEVGKKEYVVFIKLGEMVTFTNNTDQTVAVEGESKNWGATVETGESYSQIFEKTGDFRFNVNGNPIGLVKVKEFK